MNGTCVAPWDDNSTADFLVVARVGFSSDIHLLTDKILANPLRRLEKSCGDIAYENGKPVCIQAAIMRRVVYKGMLHNAVVGGMLARLKGSSPVSLLGVMKGTLLPRADSTIFLSNTACEASMKMNKMLGVRTSGPESCSQQRLQPIHWVRFAWYMFVHKVFKRQNLGGVWKGHRNEFGEEFADFWRRYSDSVSGFYSSRTVEELRWAFSEEKYVVLTCGVGQIDGYIVLKTDATGNRWSIADWIAIGNDEQLLDELLIKAKKFLRARTHAILFMTTGYPTFVQPLLARHFRYLRPLANNEYLYRFEDGALAKAARKELDARESWFFGAYDGDACLF